MKRRLLSCLACLASCLAVGCGPSEPRIVVHADAPVVVDPAPDKPGFDPRSARLKAAGREVMRVSGRTLVLHVDAALLSNDPTRYEDALVSTLTSLARVLAGLEREDSPAFVFAMKPLEEIFVRYEPLAESPRAKLDAGGKRLVVETRARNLTEIPFYPVLLAVLDAYDDATEREMTGPAPAGDAAIERRFVWLTRTRPGRGSVVVAKAEAKVSADSREARGREAAAEIRLAVLDLEARADAPELRARMRAWLVGELPRLEALHRDPKRLALLPRDSAVFRAEAAYDAWVAKRFWELTAPQQEVLADQLFPRGAVCRGDEASCASARVLARVPRLDIGMKLLGEARSAGWDPKRSAHPELVARVVCPSQRDARGKPRETCNASFAAHAIATSEGRARLLAELVRAHDASFVSEVAATLSYAHPDDIRAFLRGFESAPKEYKEAVRALTTAAWDRARTVVEDETRRAYTTSDPDLRAATLTVLAETRGKLHRHYADGYFERFEKEWGAKIDPRTLGAFLEGAPARVADVPRLWRALDARAKVGPVAAALEAFLATPRDALEDPHAVTLEAWVARLCEDGTKDDLAKAHSALEGAARKGRDAAAAVGNALADSAPGKCRKKDAVAEDRN